MSDTHENTRVPTDPDEWATALINGLSQAITAMVVITLAGTDEERKEIPMALQDVMRRLADEQGSKGAERINWGAFTQKAPTIQGDQYALSDVVTITAFYTRLLSRALVQYSDGTPGPFEDDSALLGYLKVFISALATVSKTTALPPLFYFAQEFSQYGTDQAVAEGTLVPLPDGEEGEYVSATKGENGVVRGPWGLTREGFLSGDFPHGDAVYDTIMTQIATADEILTI